VVEGPTPKARTSENTYSRYFGEYGHEEFIVDSLPAALLKSVGTLLGGVEQMQEESEVVVLEFEFNGTAEWRNDKKPVDDDGTPDLIAEAEKEESISRNLTDQAADIAQGLQTEVTPVFQRFTTGRVIVQANVKFSAGTIGIDGFAPSPRTVCL
jgi:hypothetical protein